MDTDQWIEAEAGLSIPDIFSRFGEKHFRELETAALMQCLQAYPIIATGGGIILSESNRDLLQEQAFVVYLKVSLATLEKRLVGTDRPLLKDPTTLSKIFHSRQSLYEGCAQLTLETDRLTIEEIAKLLVQQ